jgi:glycosyltransferase involved in cell wall biosynthesis
MEKVISVIVPCYNVEQYVERCMNSILSQTRCEIEIIAVNDGSTDDTGGRLQKYLPLKQFMYIEQANSGLSAARNAGIAAARGEYITFIDSDDYIMPDMFAEMLMKSTKYNTDILCCGVKKDFGGQRFYEMSDYMKFKDEIISVTPQNQRDLMYKLAISGRSVTAYAKFYNRDFLNDYCLRFDTEAYFEDYAFNQPCYALARRVGTISQSFYIYCDRPGSRMYTVTVSDIERNTEILWKLFLDYGGAEPEDVKAYASARIVSSILFNLKLKPLPLETVCETVQNIIRKLGLLPHLERAADEKNFSEYAQATAMSHEAAKNYLLFIRSLQAYDTMLAWQKRYAEIEKRGKV